MRRALATTVAALVLIAPTAAVAAECPRTSVADVEDEVMCPVCGTPLELATEAPQAQRERALIEQLVADCATKDEVKDRLVAEFGDEVLALPGDDGFDLAAYLVPALAILAAAGAVGVAAVGWRRVRKRDGGAGDDEGAPTPAAAERLQSDLDRYDL